MNTNRGFGSLLALLLVTVLLVLGVLYVARNTLQSSRALNQTGPAGNPIEQAEQARRLIEGRSAGQSLGY